MLSSGSTVGATNNVPFRIWLVVFNDAGTLRLGLVNCRSGISVLQLNSDVLRSSTRIAAASDGMANVQTEFSSGMV